MIVARLRNCASAETCRRKVAPNHIAYPQKFFWLKFSHHRHGRSHRRQIRRCGTLLQVPGPASGSLRQPPSVRHPTASRASLRRGLECPVRMFSTTTTTTPTRLPQSRRSSTAKPTQPPPETAAALPETAPASHHPFPRPPETFPPKCLGGFSRHPPRIKPPLIRPCDVARTVSRPQL